MSLNVAGINVVSQSLDNEYRITILEKIIEKILKRDPNILTPQDFEKIREEALKTLQNKYPQAGIKKKDNQ